MMHVLVNSRRDNKLFWAIDRIDGQGITVAYFSKPSPFEQFEIRNSMTRDDQLKLDEILKYPEVANLE